MIMFKVVWNSITLLFIFENEASTVLFYDSSPSLGFSIGIRRSKLPVSNGWSTVVMPKHSVQFSDYSLSVICTFKCDDNYLKCIAACGDSNCMLNCNRASNACYDGKFI